MYLLLACSLFVGYIGIERAIFYGDMDAGKAFAEQFYTQMKLRRYDQAQRLAMDGRGGLPSFCRMSFSIRQVLTSRPSSKCSRASSWPNCAAVSTI